MMAGVDSRTDSIKKLFFRVVSIFVRTWPWHQIIAAHRWPSLLFSWHWSFLLPHIEIDEAGLQVGIW